MLALDRPRYADKEEHSSQICYNLSHMKREKIANLSRSGYRIIATTVMLLIEAIRHSVGILAGGVDTTDTRDDHFQGSCKGGSYNFRTRKFDDGTDPIGWYSIN
jgi:hypothetical protein